MAAALFYSPFIPTFSANGLPVAGASLTFYYTGTTTLAPIYADSGLSVPLANPVESNAAAKYVNIYLNEAIVYRVRTLGADGVQIGEDIDPYIPGTPLASISGNDMAAGLFTDFATQVIRTTTELVRTEGYDTLGVGEAFYAADDTADAALAAAHPRFCKADAAGRYWRLLPEDGSISALAGGAATDATTIADASKYALAIDCRKVHLADDRTWQVEGINWPVSGYGGLVIRTASPGVVVDTRGAMLRAEAGSDGYTGLSYCGDVNPSSYMTIVAAVAEGSKTITVNDASLCAVGDWLLYRLGSIPYDTPESYNWGFAQVVARDTGTDIITLNRAMKEFSAGDLAIAATANKILQPITDPMFGRWLGDANFDFSMTGGYTGAAQGFTMAYLVNPKVGHISGKGLNNGMAIQYVEDFALASAHFVDCHNTTAEDGNGIRTAEARGRIGRLVTEDCDKCAIWLEGASDVAMGELIDHNYSAVARDVILVTGNSHIHVDRVHLKGLGGQNLFNVIDGSATVSDLIVETATMPTTSGGIGHQIKRSIELRNPDRTLERYLVANTESWDYRLDLSPSLNSLKVMTPPGRILVGVEVFTSSGATGVTTLNIQRDGTGGVGSADISGLISAGNWKRLNPVDLSHVLNSTQTYRDAGGFYINYATSGAAASNEFVVIRLRTIPDELKFLTALSKAQTSSYVRTMFDTVDALAAASTTDILTGTNTAKFANADAIAGLWEKGGDIASAGTIAIGEGGYFHVTGTTTITDIDPATDKAGRDFALVFDGILTLTHHATTLILPTGANITTAAGDVAHFKSEGSDAVRCVAYQRKDGTALAGSGGGTWQLQWGPLVNEPPASNYATLDSRNAHPVLDFDTTTQEAAIFSGILPTDYSGAGLTVSVWCAATSATTGTIGWLVSIERMDASSLDIDADSFASANTVTATTVPGTSGQLLKLSVNISSGANMDSLAAGEMFRLKIERDVTNDTAAGDAELLRVMLVSQ